MTMSITEMAEALGLSKGQVSKLADRGMPLEDVSSAIAWRTRYLDPSWAKQHPVQGDVCVPADGALDVARVIVRGFLARSTSFGVFTPEAAVGLLVDAGIRDFTGEQAHRLAAGILLLWMECGDQASGGDLEFETPLWVDRPHEQIRAELDLLRQELTA